jgi:hypothetical protein
VRFSLTASDKNLGLYAKKRKTAHFGDHLGTIGNWLELKNGSGGDVWRGLEGCFFSGTFLGLFRHPLLKNIFVFGFGGLTYSKA